MTSPTTILIVDDEPAHAEAIRRALESASPPYQVQILGNLGEYRRWLGENTAALVLLDLNLPDGRALEVLSAPPENNPFPVLIMTSYGNEDVAVEALKAGALDYVVKSSENLMGMSTIVARALREWSLLKTREEARAQLRLQGAALSASGEAIVITDAIGQIEWVNPAFTIMTGYRQDEAIGHMPKELVKSGLQDRAYYAQLWKTILAGRIWRGELINKRKNGSLYHEYLTITPVMDDEQKIAHFVAIKQDISDRKGVELELRIAATAFESQEGMFVTNAENQILRVNGAFTRLTGYSAEEVVGQQPAMFKSGRHDQAFYNDLWHSLQRDGHWQGEIWNRRKSGEVFPEWLTITAVTTASGQVTHYVAAFSDITERKEAETRIRNLAFYDPLTELPNRRLLVDRLGQALATSARTRRHGALLFIDLDHFKMLNDTRGHDVGDRLLVEIARRLQTCVREEDTVARLGGDEFVIMLEDLDMDQNAAASQIGKVADKILACLNQPYYLTTDPSDEHHSTPSIGASLFVDHGDTVDDLLKRADLAMYQAKEAGRNTIRFFDPAMQANLELRASLESALRKALPNAQLLLYYQPQMDRQGNIFGAEALLRWQHPSEGLILPARFIPLAEDSGLILPIGQWVLESACHQLRAWQADPLTRHLRLSINVSARQFRQENFVDAVARAIEDAGINPGQLELELTEGLVLDNLLSAMSKMHALRLLGVGLSMDDFGTGYSSLAYLKRLPFSQLKIDQSFVQDVATDSNDAAIVQAVITMAEALGMNVVAEGVESEPQQRFLAARGCRAYQGFLFSKPLPLAEFTALLTARTAI